MGNPERGLRKVFPENADMPDSEVAADEVAEGSPRNKVGADIRRVVAEVADNQRLRGHPRRPRCPAAAHLPRLTPDSHSIAFCRWADICSNAADEREDENTSADNTDPDIAAACRSTAGNTSYKSRHPYCLCLQKSWKWQPDHPNPLNFVEVWASVPEVDL